MPVLDFEFPATFDPEWTFDNVASAIQTQIAKSSGLDGSKVIWDDQTVPRPTRPFIALSIIHDSADEPLSEEGTRPNPDANLDTDNVAQLFLDSTDRPEITVRCVCFSDGPKSGAVLPALRILKKLRASLGGETAAEALDPITVLDRSNVQVVSAMLETGYEGRAVFDLKFGTLETNSDSVGTIETVKTEVTIKDLDGSAIIDTTITLPSS